VGGSDVLAGELEARVDVVRSRTHRAVEECPAKERPIERFRGRGIARSELGPGKRSRFVTMDFGHWTPPWPGEAALYSLRERFDKVAGGSSGRPERKIPSVKNWMRKSARRLAARYQVEPGRRFPLRDVDPGDTAGLDIAKKKAQKLLETGIARLAELQDM